MNATTLLKSKPFLSIAKDTNRIDTLEHVNSNGNHHKLFTKPENKKLIAAILAFPIPFGFIGLHRIYLGTEPWVPVVYFITLGGGMILPLIDFFAILSASDEELKNFVNNPNLFMWVK